VQQYHKSFGLKNKFPVLIWWVSVKQQISAIHNFHNWKSCRRDALPSATGRFRQQQLEPGTVYLPRLKPPTHCCSSGERQKRTFSTSCFWTNLRTIADSRTSQCSQHVCLNYVQCPCNVSMWQCHSNPLLINNNNNNSAYQNAKVLWTLNETLGVKFLTITTLVISKAKLIASHGVPVYSA